MYIAGFAVDGFGHFHDLEQRRLSRGLNVFSGPNEAGKSTLLEFLTYVLFGVEARASKPQALAGGRPGGRLFLAAEDRGYVLERIDTRPPTLRRGDQAVDTSELSQLLGQADRRLFRSVFGFALSDLQSLNSFEDNKVRDRIFAAGIAGASQSAAAVRESLDQEINDLWRPRKRERVTQLDAELERLEQQIGEARGRARSFPERRGQLDALEMEREGLEAELEALSKQQARTESLVRTVDAWRALDLLRREREQLGDVGVLDASVRTTLAGLLDHQREISRKRDDARLELDAARGRLDAVRVDERLERVAGEVEGVARRASAIEERSERAQALAPALRKATDDALARLRSVGPEWDAGRIEGLDRSVVTQDEARRWAATLPRDLEELTSQERALADEVERLARARAAAAAELDDIALDPVIEAIAEDVAKLSHEEQGEAERARTIPEARARATAANARVVEARASLGDGWTEDSLSQVQTDIAAADTARRFQTRFVEAVAARAARTREVEKSLVSADDAVKAAQEALDARTYDQRPLRVADEIGILAAGVESYRTTLGRRAELETTLDVLRRDLASQRARIADDALWAQLERLDVSLSREQALCSIGARAGDAEAQLHARAGEREFAEVKLRAVADNGDGPTRGLEEIDRDGEALTRLRAALDDASDKRTRHAALLGAAPATPSGSSTAGARWPALLGTILALALATWGVLAGSLVAALVGLAIAAVLIFDLVVRRRTPSASDSTAELAKMQADAAEARRRAEEEIASHARALGLDENPTRVRVEELGAALHRERSKAERRLERANERGRLTTLLADGEAALVKARQAADDTRTAFLAALREHGLPASVIPGGVAPLFAALRDAHKANEKMQAASREAERADAAISEYLARLNHAAAVMELGDVVAEHALGKVAELVDRLSDARHAAELFGEAERDLRHATERRDGARKEQGSLAPLSEQIAALEREWAQSRGALGIAPAVAPETALALFAGVDALRAAQRDAVRAGDALSALESASSVWVSRLDAAARQAALDVDPSASGRHVALQRLRERSDHARTARGRAMAHRGSLDTLARQSAEHDAQAARFAERWRATDLQLAEWHAWRARIGLPDTVTPASVLPFFEAVDEASKALARLSELEREAREIGIDASHFIQTTATLAARLDDVPPAGAAASVAWIRALEKRAQDALKARGVWDQRKSELDERARALEQLESQLDGTTTSLDALCRDHGASNARSLEERILLAAEAARLDREIAEKERQVSQLAGRYLEAADFRESLESHDVGSWRARLGRLAQDIDRGREERDSLLVKRTSMSNELDRFLAASDVAALENERTAIDAERERAAERLALLRVSHAMLEETLARFRRLRQPEVLRSASRFLSQVTGGRYARVIQGESLEDVDVVDAGDGVRRLGQLSRGTAELLYVCLRLGLAEELAGRGVDLPLVMDDVLVNFDPERAALMAGVLASVAEKRQVLYFTCRPETKQLLQDAAPGCSVIELPRYAGREHPVYLRTSTRASATAESTAGDGRRDGRSDGAEAAVVKIVECLHAAGRALTKGEILAAAEVAEGDWATAIRRLLEERRVESQGQKRGTRYSVVAGA